MKKTLVVLFTLVALAVGVQVSQAACPCSAPCDPCPQPSCCPAAPCDSCSTAPAEACMVKQPKCKCTWWKIFEDKTCCYKCNNECDSCCSAKRAHWYKFWTDRCVVKNVKCDDCKKCSD
jgi:hypothetical protein